MEGQPQRHQRVSGYADRLSISEIEGQPQLADDRDRGGLRLSISEIEGQPQRQSLRMIEHYGLSISESEGKSQQRARRRQGADRKSAVEGQSGEGRVEVGCSSDSHKKKQ